MIHPFVTYYLQALVLYGVLLLGGGGIVQWRRGKKRSAVTLFSLSSALVLAFIGAGILRHGI